MGIYIKLDSQGNPIGNPMLGANVMETINVSHLGPDILKEFGYAEFQWTQQPANGVVTTSNEYFMDIDGIVRNKVEVRPFTQEELLDIHIRNRRNFLLGTSDWTQAVDVPLTAAQKTAWATYRQALRDLPSKFPNAKTAQDVTWPLNPNEQTTPAAGTSTTTGTAST